MKIYIAGPLFTAPEIQWNKELSGSLRGQGFETFLPQEDCHGDNNSIFRCCVEGIDKCDVILANVDGTDPDSGTCFEVGYAYAKNKMLFMYRTDFRKCGDDGAVNLMLSKSCDQLFIVNSVQKLVDYVTHYVNKFQKSTVRQMRDGVSNA